MLESLAKLSIILLHMTILRKYFQNFMCNFREKWEIINAIIWNIVPHLNLWLFTISVKSIVLFLLLLASVMVSVCLTSCRVNVFLLTQVLVKTMLKNFTALHRKLWRFGKRSLFLKISLWQRDHVCKHKRGILVFYFPINFAKICSYGLKKSGNIAIKYPFHFSAHFLISYKFPKCL